MRLFKGAGIGPVLCDFVYFCAKCFTYVSPLFTMLEFFVQAEITEHLLKPV